MNQEQCFKSNTSHDEVKLIIYLKTHRVVFNIVSFDELSEHIKLLADVITYLKQEDIKWVVLKLDNNLISPTNAIWFQNKKTGDINCHIEDFEKVYLANLNTLVRPELIYINYSNIDADGWTVNIDKKSSNITN